MNFKLTIYPLLKSYFAKYFWIYLIIALFSGAGTYMSFVKIYDLLFERSGKMGILCFLIPSICIGFFFLFWRGLQQNGFFRRKISIAVETAKINVKFGDIFSQPGVIVIGVNNYFDSEVETDHVSLRSLHGILLKRYWQGNSSDWCSQISKSIEEEKLLKKNARPSCKHKDQYAIGTTAFVKAGELKAICVAQAETNNKLIAEGSDIFLLTAVHAALERGRECCNGEPLNFPLLGSGLSRLKLSHMEIANLILTAIVDEVKKQKVTDEINLILHWPDIDKFDFIALQRFWRK